MKKLFLMMALSAALILGLIGPVCSTAKFGGDFMGIYVGEDRLGVIGQLHSLSDAGKIEKVTIGSIKEGVDSFWTDELIGPSYVQLIYRNDQILKNIRIHTSYTKTTEELALEINNYFKLFQELYGKKYQRIPPPENPQENIKMYQWESKGRLITLGIYILNDQLFCVTVEFTLLVY